MTRSEYAKMLADGTGLSAGAADKAREEWIKLQSLLDALFLLPGTDLRNFRRGAKGSSTNPITRADPKSLGSVNVIASKVAACVRGARAKRGDPRTEPRRLSGVSSRPVKVGAAGTRLALERRDWTWHWASPKELIEDPAILFRLARSPSAHKSRLFLLRLPGPRGIRQRNFFFAFA